VLFPVTLSDLQGHSPTACLLECDFSDSCAADDEMSADTERRAVPLQ